ncbi:hypothetical protein LCGC14_1644230 [marine sediment metagenome]|uniref:Uncharacterized protein n=1 Tax=marine sediment metagenome TaxID=412755 RepID=A0A0F9KYK2_9ZZZZ
MALKVDTTNLDVEEWQVQNQDNYTMQDVFYLFIFKTLRKAFLAAKTR